MNREIERKYLVTGTDWRAGEPKHIRQGYLCSGEIRTVRVRIAGNSAVLTVKGESIGIERAEFEYPIPLADAEYMLTLCSGLIIEKRRYVVRVDSAVWEVDEFLGENSGLVIAEIELSDPEEIVVLPDWVGLEVSEDPRYFNARLAVSPFSRW